MKSKKETKPLKKTVAKAVCERCGAEGERRELPWIKTLCKRCFKKEKREIKEIFGEL